MAWLPKDGLTMMRGFASIGEGMASIGRGLASIMDTGPSPTMRRIMRDMAMSDADRLAGDAKRLAGDRTPRHR